MTAEFFSSVQGMPTANDIIFAGSVAAGALFHYIKKVAKKETTVSMKEWFGAANLPGTIMSFGGIGLAILAALSTNITDGLSFYALIYAGITTGFTIDSSLNSDGTKKSETDVAVAVVETANAIAPTLKKATAKKAVKETK